eukprot:2033306-Pyramimonas_sp.AAC.1
MRTADQLCPCPIPVRRRLHGYRHLFLLFDHKAHECGWIRTPTGVLGSVRPSSSPTRDSVVGCATPRHGLARGCAARSQRDCCSTRPERAWRRGLGRR